VDRIILQFEAINSGDNIYLLNPYQYVKRKYQNEHKITRPKSFKEYYSIIKSKNYDFIIVHGLDNFKMRAINKLPRHVKIVWVMWGGDFYSLYGLNKNIIGIKTWQLLFKNTSFFKRCKILIQYLQTQNRILYNIITNLASVVKNVPSPKRHIKVLNRINYFATNIMEDFILLSSIPIKGKHVPFLYNNINVPSLYSNRETGNNILIGNSGAETNNHVEIFELLSKFKIDHQNIIVPLSYGDNQEYRSSICSIGNEFFGNNFLPLMKILPKDEYDKLLNTCSIIIMNHNRQQGVANIVVALSMGCKVYLNKNITTFAYLKRLGFNIYSIQDDLVLSNINALLPLSIEEMEKNKYLALKEFGEDRVYEYTLNLIKTIKDFGNIHEK
jgi:hypothetical protein